MKLFIIFISLISLGVNAGLAEKYAQQQQQEEEKRKNNPEADEMFDLMSNKKKRIIETLEMPEYNFKIKINRRFKPGGVFINDKYIFEFDTYSGQSEPLKWSAANRKSCSINASKILDQITPLVIGIKRDGVYVNTRGYDSGGTSFEIDLSKNSCYMLNLGNTESKVEKCPKFSRYTGLNTIELNQKKSFGFKTVREKMKRYFNLAINNCIEKYEQSRFGKLKFPE